MRRLARLRSLLRRWRRTGAHERALDAELQAYLQTDVDARIRAGESPAEARRQALLDLGGVEQVKEVVRDGRTGAWVDGVLQDVRYAVRTLRRSPGFTASVIGSVSLGIAAMIAGFAFANAILVRPVPGVRDPGTLMAISVEKPEGRGYGWYADRTSANDYRVLASGFRDVGPVAASYSATVGASLPAARSLQATLVSSNYFAVLGAGLALGTPFGSDQDAPLAHDVVVLSHRVWAGEFGADPDVVGRVIRIGDLPVQIVGVASADFGGTSTGLGRFGPDIWLPLRLADRVANTHPRWSTRLAPGERLLEFVGRLADRREIARAQARSGTVAAQIVAARGTPAETRRVVVSPLGEAARRRLAPLVALVMPVPILVLLIACANAANLLLARATVREREIAVRLSIGAGRSRIVRQLLLESLLLAGASTMAAVPLVMVGLRLAEDALFMSMPLDGVVIGLTLATVAMSAIAFGLEPALRATSRPPARGLSHSHAGDVTPAQSRTGRTLVVVQVALSLGLLAMGNQLIAAIRSTDRAAGTRPDQLLMASFDVRQVNMSPAEADRFYALLLTRVSAHQDVESAGVAPPRAIWTFGKGTQEDNAIVTWRETDGLRDGEVYIGGYAAGDLFAALGLPIVAGRAFTTEDQHGARPRVAIVNQPFAERLMKGRALGQILQVKPFERGPSTFGGAIPVQIVGVIEPAAERSYTRDGKPVPAVYLPIALTPDPALTLYAKSRTSADALIPVVREIVHDIDPRVAFADIGSLADVNARAMAPMIAMARAGTLLGVIALVLAAWGLYAVMSHFVAMRSREFAVRIALGAETRRILSMVAWQAGVLALIGGSIGTLAGFVIGQLIQAEMHGTASAGLTALIGSAALLAVAMFVASFVPAARAARVSPLALLKEG